MTRPFRQRGIAVMSDHIGPIEGLNFMSLNMNDEQWDVISRAITAAYERVKCPSPTSAEDALTYICADYIGE